jgi:tetratricopeptide (TPR) repeat protein
LPRRLARVLRRGLSADPAARYPSMDALLAELSRGPARRGWLALALGGALVAGYFAAALPVAPASRCVAGAAKRLAEVWGQARRGELRDALLAGGAAHGPATWARVERAIDARADAWKTMFQETCESTLVRAQQSDALFDRRVLCLNGQLQELATQIEVLATADDDVLDRAAEAVDRLPPATRCGAVEVARAPPVAPTQVAAALAVQRVQAGLSHAAAVARAGRVRDALAETLAARRDAEATGEAAVIAAARLQLGELQLELDQPAAAEELLFAAIDAARASGDASVAARAMLALVDVRGIRLAQTQEGLRWARLAEAELQAFGLDPALHVTLWSHRSALEWTLGDHAAALAWLQRAEQRAAAELGPQHSETARLRLRLARALWSRARYEEAAAVLQTAEAAVIADLGPDHPETASVLFEQGALAWLGGRHEEALARFQRALAIRERAYGPGHSAVARCLGSVGAVLATMGRFTEAMPYFERALAALEAIHGPEHNELTATLENLSQLAAELGDHTGALQHARRSLAIRVAALGESHPDVARARLTLAARLHHGGDHEAAIVELERARSLRLATDEHAVLLGRASLMLARAWLASGRDPARARQLLDEAIVAFRRHGSFADGDRAEAEALRDELARAAAPTR